VIDRGSNPVRTASGSNRISTQRIPLAVLTAIKADNAEQDLVDTFKTKLLAYEAHNDLKSEISDLRSCSASIAAKIEPALKREQGVCLIAVLTLRAFTPSSSATPSV